MIGKEHIPTDADNTSVTIIASGELDLMNASEFRAALAAAREAEGLKVDLRSAAFWVQGYYGQALAPLC